MNGSFLRASSLIVWACVFVLSAYAPLCAEVLTKQPLMYSTPSEAPKTLYFDGKAGIAFYDTQGWLKLMRPDEATLRTISPQAHPDVKNSYIGFYNVEGNIYTIWRPKLAVAAGDRAGDKHILFSASYDGGKTFSSPVQLDSGNGAFHPKPLAVGADGLLYVVWADERAGTYRIYMNRSGDRGRTWLKEDVRMSSGDGSAYEPFVEAHGKFVFVGWLEPGKVDFSLKVRRSEDGGGTWSEETKIPTPGVRLFTPEIVKTNAGLSVIYYADDNGIMSSFSKDNGKTWGSPSLLPGTKDVGSSGFKIVKNSNDDVCLMWPGPFNLEGKKADIYASCSHDGGVTWSGEPARLDTNTPRLTHSIAPDIAMDEEGRVAVVWQDVRNIRPNIYLNYSLDAGRSWLKRDILINRTQGGDISQFPSIATDGKGRFFIAWQEATSDSPKREYSLAYEEIVFQCPKLASQPARDLCKVVKESDRDSRKTLLMSRIEEFWKAYVDGNFKKGYEMLDPFFRARVSLRDFEARVGQIKYLEFNILKDKLSMTENLAHSKVKVAYEAETFQVGSSQETSIPRSERELDDDWIWMDGSWFKVYEGSAGNFLPQF